MPPQGLWENVLRVKVRFMCGKLSVCEIEIQRVPLLLHISFQWRSEAKLSYESRLQIRYSFRVICERCLRLGVLDFPVTA